MSSESRVQRGAVEQEFFKLRLTGSGIIVGRRETTHFTDDQDPSVREWLEPFNQYPHADMINGFNALGKYAIEIYKLNPKTVTEASITGFTVKDWSDDNKATVYLHGKYRATDDQMIPLPSIGINVYASAYPNKKSLNELINNLIEEAGMYVFAKKVASPWTLFDNPTRVLESDREEEAEPHMKAV